MITAAKHHRFTVDEYYRMAQAGIFDENDRVELIDGEIIEMTPIGSRHAACVAKLNKLLWERVRERAILGVQSPVRLSRDSEPEPDVALLRPRADFYASEHPGPANVLLLIEVADTSLLFDRDFKAALYARSGIPEVWVIDLEGEQVNVFRDPKGDAYGGRETLRRGKSLRIPLPDVAELAVNDVIP